MPPNVIPFAAASLSMPRPTLLMGTTKPAHVETRNTGIPRDDMAPPKAVEDSVVGLKKLKAW